MRDKVCRAEYLEGVTIMETLRNDAYEYALLIKRELIALETLLDNWAEIEEDTERVRNGDAPDMDSDLLAECVDAQNELGLNEWPEDYADVVGNYLNDTCLELTVLRAVNEDSDRARIEILRTCGGPRCDITRDTNDGNIIEIVVHSGSDSSTVRVNVGTLAATLDELAGCY
jgi:hypothetical protein